MKVIILKTIFALLFSSFLFLAVTENAYAQSCRVIDPVTTQEITTIRRGNSIGIQIINGAANTRYYLYYISTNSSSGNSGYYNLGTSTSSGSLNTTVGAFMTPDSYWIYISDVAGSLPPGSPRCNNGAVFTVLSNVAPSTTPVAPPVTLPFNLELPGLNGGSGPGTNIPSSPGGFVRFFVTTAIGVVGGLAFLLLLFGGLRILTSAGDPASLNEGREIIVSAIAGLLFVIFAIILLKLIGLQILQIPGFVGP